MNLEALRPISYGLYIIGSRKGDRINGQIANTVIQVCSEPPTISVAIHKDNLTHKFIKGSKVFTVSILCEDAPLSLIRNFGFKSGKDADKFNGINYIFGETKAPIVLDHAVAYLEARVIKDVDVGTHTIFIGNLVGAEVLNEDEPMTYAHYHRVKRGTTPKTAPSYISEKKGGDSKLAKYKCSVCGYVYDPENGDTENDVAPGTAFEKLPDDWVCPVCGASKDQFERL